MLNAMTLENYAYEGKLEQSYIPITEQLYEHYVPNFSHTPLLHVNDLPGPLSMKRLEQIGALNTINPSYGFIAQHGETLFGRAMIVERIAPRDIPVCARTAAWIWAGGYMPQVVDVLSTSHFRTHPYGRRIRVFTRNVPADHLTRVGPITLTTVMRTICDLAVLAQEETRSTYLFELAKNLFRKYNVDLTTCLELFGSIKHMHHGVAAKQFITLLKECS